MQDIFECKKELLQKKNSESCQEYEKECNLILFSINKNMKIIDKYTTKRYTFDYLVLSNCIFSNVNFIKFDNNIYYVIDQESTLHNKNNFEKCCFMNENKLKSYDKVILLSSVYGSQIFHYPFDCLTRLLSLPDEILNDESIKIHVSCKTPYVKEWNDIFGLSDSRFICENVAKCSTLIIPRPQFTSTSTIDCNLFVREKVHKQIEATESSADFKYIVYIKRNYTRGINKYLETELLNVLKKLAKEKNLTLKVHDDKHLPNLKEQFKIFYQSKYVIGPHGAAGICLYAMQKGSYFFEFMQKSWYNPCFRELAKDFDIYYVSVLYDQLFNITDVKNIISTYF